MKFDHENSSEKSFTRCFLPTLCFKIHKTGKYIESDSLLNLPIIHSGFTNNLSAMK